MAEAYTPEVQKLIDETNTAWGASRGSERLWRWFGLGRSAFCVLPRVYMHAMPEEWQEKMARLLEEWDESIKHTDDLPFDGCRVQAIKNNKLVPMPNWLVCYRHPAEIISKIVQTNRLAGAEGTGGNAE